MDVTVKLPSKIGDIELTEHEGLAMLMNKPYELGKALIFGDHLVMAENLDEAFCHIEPDNRKLSSMYECIWSLIHNKVWAEDILNQVINQYNNDEEIDKLGYTRLDYIDFLEFMKMFYW